MSKLHQLIIAFALITFVVIARLAPHPANVAPVAAAALFAGAYLSKRFALAVPLIAMFASDLVLGFYETPIMLAVYGCFAFSVVLGMWTRQGFPSLRGVRRATSQSDMECHPGATLRGDRIQFAFTITAASLFGSIVFFLVTNFAVWAASSWYPHTLQGLLTNYTLALPFFRNTLLGDLFFAGAFFGVAETVCAVASRHKKEPVLCLDSGWNLR